MTMKTCLAISIAWAGVPWFLLDTIDPLSSSLNHGVFLFLSLCWMIASPFAALWCGRLK
jgi:hypothetical protein